ncbi:MAG TPA: triose-phosphate isomerase [Planctomycetota bacterium]|nr:triose-phosphate isomerase [Planctomycetota bacterium]
MTSPTAGPPAPRTRRFLVAGNWKMNGDRALASTLADAALSAARSAPGVDVVLCPPFVLLPHVAERIGAPKGPVALGGQSCHWEDRGAHTSSIAATMLLEAGCRYVLCGHSEVRRELGFDDPRVRGSVESALRAGLRPIACVGETGEERDRGEARSVVLRQVDAVLAGLPGGAGGVDIAYEPVWAIGTGRHATPEVAAEVHGWIRARLDAGGGQRSRILYGGSVQPANIAGFLSRPGVDGVLVGGQSLDALAFASLVDAARDATVTGSRT